MGTRNRGVSECEQERVGVDGFLYFRAGLIVKAEQIC